MDCLGCLGDLAPLPWSWCPAIEGNALWLYELVSMVIVVLVLNGLITCGCLVMVWHIWQFRKRLVEFNNLLSELDQNLEGYLEQVSRTLAQNRDDLVRLKQQYCYLQSLRLQFYSILAIVRLGNMLWQSYDR